MTDNFTGNTVQPPGSSGGVYNWYPVQGLTDYSVSNNGLMINSDASGFGAGLTTYPGNGTNAALSTPGSLAVNDGNGVVYQYGYFQATLSFNPNGYQGSGDWPAFWMGDATNGPSNPNGNFAEMDILEGMPGWPPQAGVPAENTATLLEWAPNHSKMLAQNAFDPAQVDFTKPNTFGMLWTPTSISIYLNNVLQSTVAIGPGTPYPSAAIDYANLILGTGYNWPVTFNSVDIWQSGQLPTSSSGGSGSSGVTPCAPTATAALTQGAPTAQPANQAAPQISTALGSVSASVPNSTSIPSVPASSESATAAPSVSIAAGPVASPATPAAAAYVPPAPLPATDTVPCPSGTVASGGFSVVNGQVIGPKGIFVARGINIGPQDMSAVQQSGTALFKGLNFIRLATYVGAPYSTAQYQSFVSWASGQGIVVEFEDHAYPSPPPYTGQQLADESAWYASLAKTFAGNPFVWFGSMNEPGGSMSYQAAGPGISAQHSATYNAVRSAGNNTIILFDPFGGGNPGSVGAGNGMTASTYANMTNVAWDLHYYGWASGMSTDQTTVTNDLLGSAGGGYGIAAAQTITSANGIMPVVVGEFGDSTTGGSVDPNADQVVAAVVNTATAGKSSGFVAWTWGGSGGPDQLTQRGNVTAPYGQEIQLAIGTDTVTLSACEQNTRAITTANAAQTQANQIVNIPLPTQNSTTPSATTPSPAPAAVVSDTPDTTFTASADTIQSEIDTLTQELKALEATGGAATTSGSTSLH